MKIRFRRSLAAFLIVSIAGLGMPLPAHAALIATDSALASADRGRVAAMLERSDVRAQLQAYGANAEDVKARVDALTDEEVAQLARSMDALPAGGDGIGAIVGAALFVFLVLLITDLLGLTKVFPFTKPVR